MPALLRPTFEHRVPADPQDVARTLQRLFDAPDAPFTGQAVGDHLTVTVPRSQRRFWSPWLHVDLRTEEDQGPSTIVFARFTPHPNVWTLFMLTYIALLTVVFITGAWGLSQWMLDRPPTLFWASGGAVLLGAVMFIASRIGQSLASDQMHVLRDAVERSLTGPIHATENL